MRRTDEISPRRALVPLVALSLAVAAGCDAGETKYIGADPLTASCLAKPAPPPASLGVSSFYEKYLDATGIPILASSQPDDRALNMACLIVVHMLKKRDDVRQSMINLRMRVGVIARNEVTTDLPEYNDLYQLFGNDPDWNTLRGVGATTIKPVSSFGEENMFCEPGDPNFGENVLVGNFSSAILLGIHDIDRSFDSRLTTVYKDATGNGKWRDTYADDNEIAYFGVGAQAWLDAASESVPPDGNSNFVNTRPELKTYDPGLAEMVGEALPDDGWRPHCP